MTFPELVDELVSLFKQACTWGFMKKPRIYDYLQFMQIRRICEIIPGKEGQAGTKKTLTIFDQRAPNPPYGSGGGRFLAFLMWQGVGEALQNK